MQICRHTSNNPIIICLTSVWTLPSKLNAHFVHSESFLMEKRAHVMYSSNLLTMALFKNKGLRQQLKMFRYFRASLNELLVKKNGTPRQTWIKILCFEHLRVNIYTSIQRKLCCSAKEVWNSPNSDRLNNDCKQKPCTVISLTEEDNYNKQRGKKRGEDLG